MILSNKTTRPKRRRKQYLRKFFVLPIISSIKYLIKKGFMIETNNNNGARIEEFFDILYIFKIF